MRRSLVIIGALGNCVDILDAVQAQGESRSYEVVGFLDDDPKLAGSKVSGVPILGPLALAREMAEMHFINGIGSPRSHRKKHELINGLGLEKRQFATVMHPAAAISSSARIGNGCALLANCTICAGVQLGDHVTILPNSVVGHDSKVADYATLAAGAIVSGSAFVGESCYLGAASCVREYVSLGAGSLLGMGGVLVENAPEGSRLVGNPARSVRKVDAP